MGRWTTPLAGMIAAGALVLSGCGADSGPEHNAQDVMFAQMMVPHHRQAVQMAGLAATKAGPAVAKLAATIKSEQGPQITTMAGWLKTWSEPPTMAPMKGMDDGMVPDADVRKLGTMSGAAFDHEFLTLMIKHHQGAVAMAKTEGESGTFPAAKSLAAKMITTQTAEITKMRGMQKTG